MNALAAIEFYRVALLRLVEGMFSSAGIVAGGDPVTTLPKPVRLVILRVLRPAETATRRIIQYVADRMAGPLAQEREKSAPKNTAERRGNESKKRAARPPKFRLFDRLKFFPELAALKRRTHKGRLPRICFLDEVTAPEPEPEKVAREPDDAVRVCRRLQALWLALNDISGHADRLRREMQRRRNAPPGKSRHGPRRPGWPPGYRQAQTHEVDEYLHELDLMVLREWKPRR